MEDSDKELD